MGGIGYLHMSHSVVKVRGRKIRLATVVRPGPRVKAAVLGVKGGVVEDS